MKNNPILLFSCISELNVRYDPVVELGSYPEAVDTAGDHGENEPNDPVTDKACTATGELEALAGNYGVLAEPLDEVCNSPGETDTESDSDKERGDERSCDTV